MRLITVAASTLNQTPLDWDGNQRRILQAIEQAKAQGVSLLCLPELCISGYGCEDSFYGTGAASTSWEILQQLARHSDGIAVTFGLPVRYGAGLYNAVAFAAEGKVIGLVAKQLGEQRDPLRRPLVSALACWASRRAAPRRSRMGIR
jgi:NAD+ synthase (glutamine-hydrolysing)